MKIRRFVAKDMKTALAQIKEELGADAVIMSNKKIPEGVELMAAVDYSQAVPPASSGIDARPQPVTQDVADDVVSLVQAAEPMSSNTDSCSDSDVPADSLAALLNRKIQTQPQNMPEQAPRAVAEPQQDISEQLKSFTERLQLGSGMEKAADTVATQPDEFHGANAEPTSAAADAQTIASMRSEMASIRQLLEHQVSGLMWQDLAQKDPLRAMLVDRLTAMGLTEHIADQLAGYIPQQVNENDAWQYALDLLAQQINTTNNDIIHRGGVVALVGPTGVGKTTTVAKLAARFAQVHGADNVALISTDTFRIAGFEQLETYGRIIGCQVKLAKDAESLAALLQQFVNKKLVLIDTAGMGQRDLRLVEHLATLISNSRVRIRNYLVLAANTQQRVMQENVERFKKIPLAGCIYTKLDESLSMGEIIATSIQNGLPIGYLTDGQRVPEDIKVANAKKLVMLANRLAGDAFRVSHRGWRASNQIPLANVV